MISPEKNRPRHGVAASAWKSLRPAAVAGVLAWTALVLRAEAPARKPSFESYRLLRTRNIFDPDRRAMVLTQTSQNAGKASKPITRSDYVALTGVMVTSDKSLAFFSGSRSEYNAVLPLKSSIAGATVIKITPENVVVERGGKQITVGIGQTVPFDSSTPVAAPAPDVTTAVPSSTSIPPTPAGNAPATNTSDIMRRMMERRQQELK